jgi:CHAT domain-containing protein/tetratricopeptide (TPR) repeat protein
MKLNWSLLRLVPLAVCLWGFSGEARAELFQPAIEKSSAKLEVLERKRVPANTALPWTKQSIENPQADSDVLLSVEGRLEEGDNQLDDGSLHDVHIFEGEAGQIVRIRLVSKEFDALLLLQNSLGEELARNDDGTDGTNAEIVFRLPETGQYRILANAYGESGRGAYQLTVEKSDENRLRRAELRTEADRLFQQGRNAHHISQYQSALELWQSALNIYRELSNRQGEAFSLYYLGNTYDSLGDYLQAIDFYQQSLAIAHELGDRQVEAASLNGLGLAYNWLGDYSQAIDFCQQSLTIARELGDYQDEAASLGNLGLVYNRLGDYLQSIDFYQQSLTIANKIRDRQIEAASFNGLGNAYTNIGDYPQAINFYQKSLAIARELGDRQIEAASLNDIGGAYGNLRDYPQAIDFHQQSLAMNRDIDNRQGEAVSLNNLGFSYLEKDDFSAAATSLFDAISVFESLRASELSDRDRINLFETQTQAYTNLVLALVLQNKHSEALEVSERSRTRSFVQLISDRLAESADTQALTDSLSFGDMQKVAKAQQSVLIEYSLVITPDNTSLLYIWVMQPTGKLDFRQVPLGDDPARLTELVSQSRRSIGARGRGFILDDSNTNDAETTDKLRELHQLMIEPIADLLPSDPAQRVVFVPQGDLFLVPFAALMDESGKYLIEQHTILTAPSIQVLDLTQRQATARVDNASTNLTALLAVGNPVMPEVWDPQKGINIQLSSLIDAEREAQDIADFFSTEALVGAGATEQAVKEQIGNARIVHLATHGLLEYGIPKESGVRDVPGAIALTPGQGNDGLLTSAEILELDLKADLVVLSACDTGLGTITGDGVIGLSRSLIAAGAPSVIVSLWSIPDAPTADLMTEFYRQMQQGQDKAQALRQAMLTTMETHPNPGDWAAFTLIGEAD